MAEKAYTPQALVESGILHGKTYRQILYYIEKGKLRATDVGEGRPQYLITESAINDMLAGKKPAEEKKPE